MACDVDAAPVHMLRPRRGVRLTPTTMHGHQHHAARDGGAVRRRGRLQPPQLTENVNCCVSWVASVHEGREPNLRAAYAPLA